jgi:signal transduction histidine kinase/CHASE3 domain sensor protein
VRRNEKSESPGYTLNQKEFQRVMFRGLLFPLVSAFLLALLIAGQIRALLDMSTWVDRSQEVISQGHRVQNLLMDMETGVRGYALTRSREYLAPYEEGRRNLAPALAKIKLLLADEPHELLHVKKVEALAEEWIVRYADVTINSLASGRRRIYSPGIGQDMMNRMREEITALIGSATVQREERLQRAKTMARVLSGGGVLLALSVGFFLAMSARRHIFHLTDLYQHSLDERNQLLDRETHRSEQLQELAELAVSLNTTVNLEDRLDIVTEKARKIIGAHQSITTYAPNARWERAIHSTSFSDRYGEWRDRELTISRPEIYAYVCEQPRSLRMPAAELEKHYLGRLLAEGGSGLPAMRGWLAAPLIGQDGRSFGCLQLSDKYEGDFTADDEFILAQIAQVAAVAVENSRLFEAEQEAVRTRDEFLSIASHELKTPLTSLRLQVQMIEKSALQLGERAPEKLAERSRQSIRSMEKITHLVDDMLDISRISAGRLNLQKESFDLAQLCREVVDRLSPLATQSGSPLHLRLREPVWGEWDRFRIDQVVTNLVANAIKYGAKAPIDISTQGKGGLAFVEVRDHGIGIAAQDHERIFQRFERVSSSESVSGMGLGLYITRQIVDMHGGRLELESDLGKGATFRVTLPLRA